MTSYCMLLGLAFIVNFCDIRMLALTLVVGAAIFVPIPPSHFYLWCIVAELVVMLWAYMLHAPASQLVILLSGLLVMFHLLGLWLNGYPPNSPYHYLVKICEHAELVACIVLSQRPKRGKE